jgi:hypothetical protein
MNATESRMKKNARELDATIKAIEAAENVNRQFSNSHTEIRIERGVTPLWVLAWFFTWTICAVGFVLAMTVAATLAKGLKMLVP